MQTKQDMFVFPSAILQEDDEFSALCLDLDVCTQGRSPFDAKKKLLEAVTQHLKVALENDQPYLKPVPASEDPRKKPVLNCLELFDLKVSLKAQS